MQALPLSPAAPARPPPAGTAAAQRSGLIFLSEAGEALLARHGATLLALTWVCTRAAALALRAPSADVQHYFVDAGRWLAGEVPYRDFSLEYPPLALLVFALPRLLTADFSRYCQLFACLMVVADALTLLGLWRLGARLGGPPGQADGDRARGQVAQVACVGVYLLSTACLGGLPLERYDLAVAAALATWLSAAVGGGARVADAALAVAIGLKAVPAALLPLWAIWRAAGAAPGARLGEGLRRVGCVAALTAATLLPAGAAGLPLAGQFITYHAQRGLQIESLWATLLMGPIKGMGGGDVGRAFRFGASEVDHPLAAPLATAAMVAVALGLGWTGWGAARRLRQVGPLGRRARGPVLVVAAAAALAWLVALNKVFSPQYVLWLAPLWAALAAVAATQPTAAVPGAMGGFLATAFLTGLGWMAFYRDLMAQDPLPVVLCLARNLLLVALAARATWALWSAGPSTFGHGIGRVARHRGWMAAATLLALVWVFFGNLSETTANDIWIQMRSGREIFESGHFPDRETYTKTVLGLPFIAHEWMSSLIFFLSVHLFGDGGLSFIASAVALGAALLLWAAVPREQRQRWWFLPLWLAANYLISFRMLMRPHIFTILAQCALVLGTEIWRRRGGWRPLLAFIPMQLLWVNLHGGAFFGPAFLAMLAGLTALLVLVPALDRGAERRRFTWADVRQLAGVALGMALVCLVNPYGTTLLTWSLELLGNDYAKQRVWEWTSPFLVLPGQKGLSNRHYYWLWLWLAHVALLWSTLAGRARRLPLIDLAQATLVTYLSVRANRFVPEMAIFSLPIVLRGLEGGFRDALAPRARSRSAPLEMATVGLLLASLASYGYAHSATEHRPRIGWGFGGDMPYQEVALMKKMGLSGTIFNEYSDGALIIHSLVPTIRPVLDSRIDLFPLPVVNAYDEAYRSGDPEVRAFRRYLEQQDISLVMLMRGRASPRVLESLAADPSWELISSIRQRVLYRRLPSRA